MAQKAEADGSLFDLKKDSVKVIATTIAGNVSLHRLTELQQALGDETQGHPDLRRGDLFPMAAPAQRFGVATWWRHRLIWKPSRAPYAT
jgi:hypothetical protein